MKKMLFLINPTAGQRRIKRYLADILVLFNRAGYQVDVHMTAGSGDATKIVLARAGQQDVIVCAGGDGTLNETITGVLRSGIQTPIGYIPCGTTNDFAASLKLPTNIMKAAQCIINGTPTAYDVGQFGDRYFSYVASCGAFTKASYATPQNIKNALGHTAYVLEGISELSQIRSTHIRVVTPERTVEDDFIFGAISNSTSLGGLLTLNPDHVDMADGLFEFTLVRKPRNLAEVSECIQAVRSQSYNCAMITFFSADSATILSDPNMAWTLDGEQAGGSEEIPVKNLHHAVYFLR